mmetsp:Transcript_92877/g.262797  ORF Transcript_92877/g.262797 Transcript_92877/m.262797 type:complete len:217 (+) Transcript_92877:751-1401(+)
MKEVPIRMSAWVCSPSRKQHSRLPERAAQRGGPDTAPRTFSILTESSRTWHRESTGFQLKWLQPLTCAQRSMQAPAWSATELFCPFMLSCPSLFLYTMLRSTHQSVSGSSSVSSPLASSRARSAKSAPSGTPSANFRDTTSMPPAPDAWHSPVGVPVALARFSSASSLTFPRGTKAQTRRLFAGTEAGNVTRSTAACSATASCTRTPKGPAVRSRA